MSLGDPLWWPALTRYTAQMQAAWLTFLNLGRRSHPELRVIFSMLAGLVPLHAERLSARGGPGQRVPDPLVFYDTSSYGPRAIGWLRDTAVAVAVAVVGGRVREERLRIDGPPRNQVFTAGESFHFSPADIHRVRHAGSDPAVTLHAYSPPLLSMGAYMVGEDGVLQRHQMD